MARLRRLFHSVASGYAVLGANIIFSLAQVPLALSFLNKAEFGLWALAFQLGTYLQLVDFGMSASVSRLLIDHKHEPNAGAYGSIIKTGFLVLIVQGLLVMIVGGAFAFEFSQWLNIPTQLLPAFRLLMIGLCAMLAITFFTKIFSHILTAYQRFDLINYSQIGLFAINYLVQWLCFHHGLGVFSILYGNAAGWILTSAFTGIACIYLHLFPAVGHWGQATRDRFREIFSYGKDVFWVALGSQLIVASQTIIVTRSLGLDAAAIWSVCTRTYTLLSQLTWRIFDYAGPALAEMIVFKEKARLYSRLKSLVVVSTSLAVVGGTLFAISNQPFVAIWTHGKIGWPRHNDVFLGLWLVLSTIVHCLCGFVLTTKAVGFMRYIYFIEGAVFVATSSFLARFGGITTIIATSIICTCLFTLPYGIWRTQKYFSVPAREMPVDWLIPPLRLMLILTPTGAAVWYLCSRSTSITQLLAEASIVSCVGTLLFLRYGVHRDLKEEIRLRMPSSWRPLLGAIMSGD